jgi:hypothetical protein
MTWISTSIYSQCSWKENITSSWSSCSSFLLYHHRPLKVKIVNSDFSSVICTYMLFCVQENLELTMTKTCLDVLTNLGKAFQSAVREGPVQPKMVSPYMVQNDTGLVITLLLNKGSFKVRINGVITFILFHKHIVHGHWLFDPYAGFAEDRQKFLLKTYVIFIAWDLRFSWQ